MSELYEDILNDLDDQVNFTNITSFMSSNCGDYDYKMNIINNIIYNIDHKDYGMFTDNIETEIPENEELIDVSEDVELLKNLKNKCINVEKEIKELIEQDKENECPICIEDIRGKSYFTGLCGHKFCARCICSNMSKNKHTGHLCPLCRSEFM